nr:bacterial transcriptional activator domain-containing protein [Methylobacterium iners]
MTSVMALVTAALLWAAPASAARLASIKGTQADRYGRIALTFDAPVSVTAKVSGSVLIVSFGERSPSGPERLALELPDYVSVVRRDPDATGMRVALVRPFRVNVQSAAEHVFIDLLPEGWSGLPPPLPSEIVTEIVRRAQVAEAAIRAATPPPVPRRVALDLSQLPTLTRLSLRLPPEATPRFERVGPATRLVLPGAWRIDETDTRGRTKPAIEALATETDADGARLLVTPAAGYEVRTWRDEEGATLDIIRLKPATEAKAAEKGPEKAQAEQADAAVPAASPAAPAKPAASAVQPMPASEPARVIVERPAGPGLVFPFRRLPAAALFERAGVATLVFETAEPVKAPPGDPVFQPVGEPTRTGNFLALRFVAPRDRLLDLIPTGDPAAPTGWELVAGEGLAASESLSAIRRPEAGGRIGIGVALPNPGGAAWFEFDGARIAVVTGYGPKPAGIPKRQAFVDFELLPSRQGVAVLAHVDDLLVRPDVEGVAIGREGGMAVSGVARNPEVPLVAARDLAIERGPWDAVRRGDVRETLREQFQAAVDAPRLGRGPQRLTLARTMIANGHWSEALGVLAVAAAEDPVLAGNRDVAILRGVAHARMDRDAEARADLATDALRSDPEARLWLAHLDAKAGRWTPADTAFRATAATLDRYPDDLQALLRTSAAEAAIESGDWESATRQITGATARATETPLRERLAFLRARIDELNGQTVAALDAYRRLADSLDRPVGAEATLRAAILGQALGKTPVADALESLETLLMTWHGGQIESKTIAALGQLYIQAGQWRQAFLSARRANAIAPESTVARNLHEAAQTLFDDLFLGDRGAALSGVAVLALYFDFKDFAPIGRRGDEIVRRLADRLVELDLLDSAADLLQHQVDHRLTGGARAAVAARVAAIRLMDEKPMLALKVLDATHLPELPEDLRRARALLRARALSDLSRTDLALETIEGETDTDALRLRADILWTGRRWRDAGEAHEALVGEAWRSRAPLDDVARADIIRAAVAYGLAGEGLGQERLRAKFAGPMAESADARTFALLTQPNAARTAGFREIASRATSAETLQAFLAEYRKRYPESAVPERGRREAGPGDSAANAEAPAEPPT